MDIHDRLAGTLLGTALGDALGLATEGLGPEVITRRFGRVQRFHLLGQRGFVSDDTEQAALVAQSLARCPDDAGRCVRAFRRALLFWFLRLPWGLGLATLRACLRMLVGLARSGVRSAGNGAAMRAAIIGAFFCDDAPARRRFGVPLAEVTHLDPRAIEGALYVAEVAAAAAAGPAGAPAAACIAAGRQVVTEPSLAEAIGAAADLAERGATTAEAARALGTTGYILHTAAFATFCFLRHGTDPLLCITEAICAGGDTDSIAAIVGAWTGALHGAGALPAPLLARISDGPFGPTHLRALAAGLAAIRRGERPRVPGFSALRALLRNLALYPVILGHGLRRLLPW